MKNFYFIQILAFLTISHLLHAQDCDSLPLELTGFNADIIAEGTGGDADDKTNYSVDGENFFSNVVYSEDFVPENPYIYSSAEEYGGGLPSDGLLTSTSSGIEFQIADYSENNVVLLRNTISNEITLEPVYEFAANKLYFAAFSAESLHTISVTIEFADGITQTESFQVADWYQLTQPSNSVVYGLGRVSRGTGSASVLNQFSDLGIIGIYEYSLDIDSELQGQAITSITFSKENTSNDAATTAIFAITACEIPLLNSEEMDQSNFEIYPNPTTGIIHINSDSALKYLEIYNLAGQKIMNTRQISNSDVNLSNFPSGVYLVKVELENGQIATFKVVKK